MMRAILAAAVLVASAGCGGPRLTAIGDGWFVDSAEAGRPAPHLYHEAGGRRVLVDRQIEAYRLYVNRCLIYEAPRADGRYLFVAWAGLTPVAFRESIGPSRWRLDADGPRRFETPMDPDGRRLLAIEWINFGDPCYTAQMQPRFADHWVSTPTRVVSDRIKIEESTIDVDLIKQVLVKHDAGIDLLLAPPSPETAELVTQDHMPVILDQLRTLHDYILVDIDKKLDEINLRILDAADTIFVVMTADLSCLKNVRLVLETIANLGYE